MRVLFVENHDSFSWNVIDALPVDRERIDVRRGGEAAASRLEACDVVVIGPGPTDPVRAGIVGLLEAAVRAAKPVLGVCLGHQAIGLAYGATLVRTVPVHGKTSTVTFGPSRMFPGIVGPHRAMRYHSLALADVVPPLTVVATTSDGIAMAIEHDSLPVAGVQFHPDSYATPRGRQILAAFFEAIGRALASADHAPTRP